MTATTIEQPASLDQLISKIEKLWRKANDPGATAAEREVFEAKALQLMEDNRIDQAALDLGYADELPVDVALGTLTGRDARLALDLLDTVARAFDCRVYWSNWGLNYRPSLFGYKSDIERVQRLWTWLSLDCSSQATCLKGDDMAHTKSLRRGFRQGYTGAIGRRLYTAKQEARKAAERKEALITLFGDDVIDDDIDWSEYEEEIQAAVAERGASKGALVLVERSKKVEAAYAKRSYRHAASTRSGAYEGRSAGRAAGERANLNPAPKVGGRARAAIGS